MNWKLAGCVAAVVLSGCSQPALIKETMSGNPEVSLKGVTMEEARNEFVLACIRTGGEAESDAYSVTCGKENDSMRGILAQALVGNRFSQTPWEKLRFSFAPVSGGVFVTVTGWMEMTMGFGEVKRIPYTGNAFRNSAQVALDNVAAKLDAKAGIAEAAQEPAVPGDDSAPIVMRPEAPPPATFSRPELDPAKRCDACKRLTTP